MTQIINISGLRHPIFQSKTECYHTDDGLLFMKFTLETWQRRIVFGIYPLPEDIGLSAVNIKELTLSKGIVKFSTGATYKKPVYRTIQIEKLSAIERSAYIQEMEAAGLDFPKAKKKKKKTGNKERGRPKTYTQKELRRVEDAIKTNGATMRRRYDRSEAHEGR